MSTQRRENHRQRRSCTERRGGSEQIWLIFLAWFARAIAMARGIAMVGTAPPETMNSSSLGRLATNSLQSDYRNTQFVRSVRLAREGIRLGSHSSPSPITGERTDKGIPATLRSSLLDIPAPSGFVGLSPALP